MPEWKRTYPGVEALNVAVMGCIVNGPGESKHADIGISLPGTGEQPTAPVFIDGRKAVTLRGPTLARDFQALVLDYIERRYGRAPERGVTTAELDAALESGRRTFRFALLRDMLESRARRLRPRASWPPFRSRSRASLSGCDHRKEAIMAQTPPRRRRRMPIPPRRRRQPNRRSTRRAGFWTLALGSIGVVYGDIGTSPLYAFKESVAAAAAGGAVVPRASSSASSR